MASDKEKMPRPKSRRRHLTDEERKLWRAVTKDAKLISRRPVEEPEAPREEPHKEKRPAPFPFVRHRSRPCMR